MQGLLWVEMTERAEVDEHDVGVLHKECKVNRATIQCTHCDGLV